MALTGGTPAFLPYLHPPVVVAPPARRLQAIPAAVPEPAPAAPAPPSLTRQLNVACKLLKTQRDASLLEYLYQSATGAEITDRLRQFADKHHLLQRAIRAGALPLFTALIKQGVAVGTPDKWGNTALHYAPFNASVHLTKMLLLKGADPNAENGFGETPLYMAAASGNVSQLVCLLEAGGTLSHQTPAGVRPVDVAVSEPARAFLQTLIQLIQLHNGRTNGESSDRVIPIKQSLLESVEAVLPQQAQRHHQISLELESVLYQTVCGSAGAHGSVVYTGVLTAIRQAMDTLEPGGFLWLSSGSRGHLMSFILQKEPGGRLAFSVVNSGDGMNKYHHKNEQGQVFAKTLRSMPATHPAFQRSNQRFSEQVAHTLATIYDKRAHAASFSVDQVYALLETLGRMDYVATDNQSGPAMDPQGSDNCVTGSLLAGLRFLHPDQWAQQDFSDLYNQHLIRQINNLAPALQPESLDAVLAHAAKQNIYAAHRGTALLLLAKVLNQDRFNHQTVHGLTRAFQLFSVMKTYYEHETPDPAAIDSYPKIKQINDCIRTWLDNQQVPARHIPENMDWIRDLDLS